jgi:hypothetical protein
MSQGMTSAPGLCRLRLAIVVDEQRDDRVRRRLGQSQWADARKMRRWLMESAAAARLRNGQRLPKTDRLPTDEAHAAVAHERTHLSPPRSTIFYCILDAAAQKFAWMGFHCGVAEHGDVEQGPADGEIAKDQREALGMLAACLRGRVESAMQAHGIAIETLRVLVQAGLATIDRGPAYFDPRVIVTMLQITDAGPRPAVSSRRR